MYLLISWVERSGFTWRETANEIEAKNHPKLPYHFVFWREQGKPAREMKF